jgi:hypothetical protein
LREEDSEKMAKEGELQDTLKELKQLAETGRRWQTNTRAFWLAMQV